MAQAGGLTLRARCRGRRPWRRSKSRSFRANAKAAGARAKRAAIERVKLAERLDAIFAEAGELLRAYGEAGRAIENDLRAVVNSAEGLADRQREARLEHVHQIARGPAGAALQHAIVSNEIGREGIHNWHLADLPRGDTTISIADAAKLSADQTAVLVNELVSGTSP